MGYVDRNLITDEVVTHRGQLHWIGLVGPALLAGASIGLAVASRVLIEQASTMIDVLAVVLVLIGSVPLIRALIDRGAAEFAVTNKRVIFKVGPVYRRTAEMFLNKIESVGVDQTILGRIFGYGSIVLRGTGGSTEPFTKIARPLEFRRQIQEQIARLSEQQTGGAGRAEIPGP